MTIKERIEEAGERSIGNLPISYLRSNLRSVGKLKETITVITELEERIKALEEYIESKKDQLL